MTLERPNFKTPAEAYAANDGASNPLWFVPAPTGFRPGEWREQVEIWARENGIDMPLPATHYEGLRRLVRSALPGGSARHPPAGGCL